MQHLRILSKVLFLILFLLTLNSCSDDGVDLNSSEDDYLIFGHFYGECGGEGCIETFKLTIDKLYEDTNDNYGGVDFNFIEMSMDKFDLVTGLENGFPKELLDATEDQFGCPDCGDWGGYYVEYSKDGIKMSWTIDTMIDDIPSYLHDFVGDIQDKITLINQ